MTKEKAQNEQWIASDSIQLIETKIYKLASLREYETMLWNFLMCIKNAQIIETRLKNETILYDDTKFWEVLDSTLCKTEKDILEKIKRAANSQKEERKTIHELLCQIQKL